MRYLVIFLSVLSISMSVHGRNWGHRASGGSGEYHSFLPENSLVALEAGLLGWNGEAPIQDHKKYTYLEFDVQETRDGHLVVFHDKTISRMIPNTAENKVVFNELFMDTEFRSRFKKQKVKYKDLKIFDFTLDELKRLQLAGSYEQQVPTLNEFLDSAARFQLRKPIIVEIKYLKTEQVKRELLHRIKEFREIYMNGQEIKVEKAFNFPETTAFLAFPKKYKKTYGVKESRTSWCEEIKSLGFLGIFQARKHSNNFCKKKKSFWRRLIGKRGLH